MATGEVARLKRHELKASAMTTILRSFSSSETLVTHALPGCRCVVRVILYLVSCDLID